MARPREESRLEALLESVRLLHASLELDDILRHLLRSAMGRLMARRGLIGILDPGEYPPRGGTMYSGGLPPDPLLAPLAGTPTPRSVPLAEPAYTLALVRGTAALRAGQRFDEEAARAAG